jgi:hypothetical protein
MAAITCDAAHPAQHIQGRMRLAAAEAEQIRLRRLAGSPSTNA